MYGSGRSVLENWKRSQVLPYNWSDETFLACICKLYKNDSSIKVSLLWKILCHSRKKYRDLYTFTLCAYLVKQTGKITVISLKNASVFI